MKSNGPGSLTKSARKRVLVTGGAGFLGSHLCERLIRAGHDVICADNFFTGVKDNIVELMDNPYFELARHDIAFPLHVEVDEIYNFACPASPIHYQFDPVQTTKTCVHGSINMLGLAKRLQARIFQASTSEVYGDPEVHPQTETYVGRVNPIGVRACYDEGKRCAETLFFDYRRQHGLEIKVARIFNTYGPRMHPNDGRVVSTFIVRALRGEAITLYGKGTQTRSFCYVDDMIEGCMRMMASAPGFTGPVNLGRTRPTAYRFALGDRIRPLARRRSDAAPARYPTRRRNPELETHRRARRGPAEDDRLLRPSAGILVESLPDASIRP
jgi:UDP-glucuronate decarboxylase